HELHEIAFALVRHQKHPFAVRMETQDAARLQNRAGVDDLEGAILLDTADLHVPGVRIHTRCKAEIAIQVEIPSYDVLLVLEDEFTFARSDVQPIHVVQLWVTIVETDVNDLWKIVRGV